MIRFLQDYTTKAIPPEIFKKDASVSRSKESELYFVQMGVAGYVVDGKLVDQDYRPIAATTTLAEVVVPGDRRFAGGGRAGEAIGLDAPQRASTGPGNSALLATTAAARQSAPNASLHPVQVDQLRSDLAASIQQLDEHRETTSAQIGALTDDLAASIQQLDEHRETTSAQIGALTDDLTAAQRDREAAQADLATANAETASLATDRDAARADAEAKAARIIELEAVIAASPPAKAK